MFLRDWLNLVSLQLVISQEVSVQDHLWKSIFWTMPELLKLNKKKKIKTLTIIISLENVIKSFNLYEDYQLSQQHEFHEHSCGTAWKGRRPSLSVAEGIVARSYTLWWWLTVVVLPGLALTAHMWPNTLSLPTTWVSSSFWVPLKDEGHALSWTWEDFRLKMANTVLCFT